MTFYIEEYLLGFCGLMIMGTISTIFLKKNLEAWKE
jgi:hypothetical protein